MAHGDAQEGMWRGNWWMEWVASTLHTTSEHGVSSITTADAHISAASSWLNWRPPADLYGLVRFARKTKSGFCACAITFQLASTRNCKALFTVVQLLILQVWYADSRLQLKCDGTRWRTGGEVKGKLVNAAGSQYTLHTTSEHGVSSITTADAHTSAASSRLNWRPHQADLNGLVRFARKTKYCSCACAITFQLASTTCPNTFRLSTCVTTSLQTKRLCH